MSETTEQALLRYFGYNAFREGQQAIVQAIMDGKDVMAVMSTGHGKSTCFQLPAFMSNKCFLVISPLLSLTDDQIDDLNKRGMVGRKYNSTLSDAEKTAVLQDILRNPVPLLYVTPESFKSKEMMDFLVSLHAANQFGALIVDEVHTVVEWGKDFRPAFLQLGQIRQKFPTVPIAAFTATSDRAARISICETLGMHPSGSPKRHDASLPFDRPNITPIFVEGANELADMQRWIEQYIADHHALPTCIAYCSSQKDCDKFATAFATMMPSMNPAAYHAGMSAAKREEVARHWKNPYVINEIDATTKESKPHDRQHYLLFATTAFGMGINKSDVRFVFQVHPPRNIFSGMQQMGRAGRDGLQSYYIFYINFGSINQYLRFNDGDLKEQKITPERHAEIKKQIEAMRTVMRNRKTARCRRAEMIGLLNGNEALTLKCQPPYALCDVCSSTPYPVVTVNKKMPKGNKAKRSIQKKKK